MSICEGQLRHRYRRMKLSTKTGQNSSHGYKTSKMIHVVIITTLGSL
jgi:hypothetical protein